MLTQNQKDIITDLIIDNGLIFDEVKSWMLNHNTQAYVRANSVIKYCHTLFVEYVYDATDDNIDYVQGRMVDLLSGLAKYRRQYSVGTNCYKLFNSLFDKTSEAFNDFNNTL